MEKFSYMIKVARVCEAPSAKISNASIACDYWKNVIARQSWFDHEKEHLIVLLLNTNAEIEGYSLVSIGTLSETLAHQREIFRAAVATSAYAIILMHNHPSGNASPSDADRFLTMRASEAGALLDVPVLDHVIVAAGGFYSFKDNDIQFRRNNNNNN